MLVINSSGKPDNLTRTLRASGMAVRLQGTDAAVSSAALKPFRSVVLENVALSSLNDRADAALRRYVTELGGGLLVTGGENSYAAGGYYQSRLEPVLPVSMVRKEAFRRPKIAMCIVLDRSGSMTMPVRGSLTKMDLANRAAAEAVAIMDDKDEIAVFAVDENAHRVVGLTSLAAKRAGIRKKILTIESMGGGIYVFNGLAAAVAELAKSDAPTRHIVLFSDANDSEEPGGYQKLVDTWAKAGGTVTVIGLGTPADVDAGLLKDIARRGKGRILFTADPNALPRVFCQDALRVARKTFINEKTEARVTAAVAQLGRLDIRRFPSFLGYNICYPRKDAAQIVITTDENKAPVLAVWQRGLGRVAAFTCEADGPHTGQLATWNNYQPFFSSLVKWLERDRDDPGLFGSIVRRGRTASVSLEMDEPTARTCTGATAFIIPPDESEPVELPLQWTSPQAMRADFRLKQKGVYHGVIMTREGKRVSLPPVVLPYSPEFEPRPAGAGPQVLKRLAEETGGQRVMHVEDLLAKREVVEVERHTRRGLAPFLAGLALVLLLSDIVTRRALWASLVPARVRAASAAVVAGLAEVPGRLGRRLARMRRRKDAPPELTDGPSEPPEPEPDKPEGPKESVFDRAKRRARR